MLTHEWTHIPGCVGVNVILTDQAMNNFKMSIFSSIVDGLAATLSTTEYQVEYSTRCYVYQAK